MVLVHGIGKGKSGQIIGSTRAREDFFGAQYLQVQSKLVVGTGDWNGINIWQGQGRNKSGVNYVLEIDWGRLLVAGEIRENKSWCRVQDRRQYGTDYWSGLGYIIKGRRKVDCYKGSNTGKLLIVEGWIRVLQGQYWGKIISRSSCIMLIGTLLLISVVEGHKLGQIFWRGGQLQCRGCIFESGQIVVRFLIS